MRANRQRQPTLRWGLLIATSLGFGVVQLDVSAVNVALRAIGVAMDAGVSALQWVVSAYTIAFAALILSAGALGDRIGARRLYVAGFVLFTVASMACGLAPTLGLLVAARAIQGIGAAVLVPCSLSLLNHAHRDPRSRGRAIGIWAAGASVALSGGPLVGGLVIAVLGWRAIFFINLPLGLVAVALARRHAEETPAAPRRGIDLPGQFTAILGLVLLAGSIIEGGAAGSVTWPVLAAAVGALLALAAFVAIEHRCADPMLPLGLFRIVAFRRSAVIGLLINVAFYGLIFVLSLFFQSARRLTPLQTGCAFAPMTVVVMGANVIAGRLSAGPAGRALLIVGAALVGGASLVLQGTSAHSTFAAVVGPLVVIGLGIGLIVPVITASLLGAVDPARSGVAAGALNTARQAGSVLGVAIFGSLTAHGLARGLHDALLITVAIAGAVVLLAGRGSWS